MIQWLGKTWQEQKRFWILIPIFLIIFFLVILGNLIYKLLYTKPGFDGIFYAISAMSLLAGFFISYYRFHIFGPLNPDFTIKLSLAGITKLESARLVVIKFTIKNIGKVTIKHLDSYLRIYPIGPGDFCKIHQMVEEIPRASQQYVVIRPFSVMQIVPPEWATKYVPAYDRYDLWWGPEEEFSVDVPLSIYDTSIVALRIIACFTSDKKEKHPIPHYCGGQYQYVFTLNQFPEKPISTINTKIE